MTDRELREQLARFEAARIEEPVVLEPAAVRGVLAVHDGTDQDAIVSALAGAIAARTGAAVTSFAASSPEPHAEILAAGRDCEVLVVPSPFGRDYASEGRLSLSTTVDLLCARSDAAICLARGPLADVEHCVTHPLVALQIERHRKVEATALALALAKDGGELLLLSVVDPTHRVHNEELIGRNLDPHDLAPEILHGLASARAAALTAALQRRAGEWDVRVVVHFGLGDVVALTLEENEHRAGLLVAGRNRDGPSEAAQRFRRLVLASSSPVLLV